MSGHSEGIQEGKFCALRTDKCSPCGNKYRQNGRPAWAAFTFLQGRKLRVNKEYEAHHLLCIACVTEFIGKKAKLKKIVEQTEWCINAKKNMIGMPRWGHTIKWYCNLACQGEILEKVKAPPFKDLPQHDYDHNSPKGYTKEVEGELKELAREIEESTDKHEEVVATLKAELDGLSDDFRGRLTSRGERCDGTHKAWKKGAKDPHSDWYLPFSMADDGSVEPRTFPAPNLDSKVADKIQKMVAAVARWSTT